MIMPDRRRAPSAARAAMIGPSGLPFFCHTRDIGVCLLLRLPFLLHEGGILFIGLFVRKLLASRVILSATLVDDFDGARQSGNR
jgi:hypothetical protein